LFLATRHNHFKEVSFFSFLCFFTKNFILLIICLHLAMVEVGGGNKSLCVLFFHVPRNVESTSCPPCCRLLQRKSKGGASHPPSSSFSCGYKTNQYFGESSTQSLSLLLSCNNLLCSVPPLSFNLQ
jgi:hypothetical protein